jgi:hypothetical protein
MHAHGFLMPDDDGPDDVEYLTTTPTHDPAEVPAEVPGTADGGERHACDECLAARKDASGRSSMPILVDDLLLLAGLAMHALSTPPTDHAAAPTSERGA